MHELRGKFGKLHVFDSTIITPGTFIFMITFFEVIICYRIKKMYFLFIIVIET